MALYEFFSIWMDITTVRMSLTGIFPKTVIKYLFEIYFVQYYFVYIYIKIYMDPSEEYFKETRIVYYFSLD